MHHIKMVHFAKVDRTHKNVGNAETQFYLNGNKTISQIK